MLNSLIEAKLIPPALFQQGLNLAFLYNGPSMHPTFKPGQILYTRPEVQGIHSGDILVYQQVGRQVVHRICSVKPSGYILRGDNNRLEDAELVMPVQVLGRVEMVGDEKGIRPVLGGRGGLWRARLRWACKVFEQPVRLVIGWPYRFLKAKGWVAHIWKPEFQVMSLGQGEARIVKYLFHDQTVAVWDAKLNRFTCRKPFDLVLRAPHA
jgi:hypothetical protein